jgi:hypothetical protein
MVEAFALHNGMVLAGQTECNKLEVNSYCMDVIEAMRYGGNSLGQVATIYVEYSFLCYNFLEVCFKHCSRESNEASDSALKKLGGLLWPVFIIKLDPILWGWWLSPLVNAY